MIYLHTKLHIPRHNKKLLNILSVCAYFLIMRHINHIKKYDVIDDYPLRSRELFKIVSVSKFPC